MPELITGTKGTPHVTSTQDRSIYEKIIGKGSYILDDNENLEPELQSNQSLRIRSGMLYHHGSITEVKRNTYDEVTIANGSQGMKRIDLVVLRYTKNPETEIEEMNWVVIQGTPAASDPVAPAYTEGNMQEGDLTDDCPFCEVHLDGIQVTEVVKLMKVVDGSLESLNSKISYIGAEKNYSENGWTLTYREVAPNFLYVTASRTANRVDSGSTYTEIYNLPFNVPFPQKAVVSNNVGPAVVGNGVAIFEANRMLCQYQEYGSAVTNLLFGLIKVSE